MHYSHRHAHITSELCVPCDCYVCALNTPRGGAHESRRSWQVTMVEHIMERIEGHLAENGETSALRVWRELGRGVTLLGVVRGVFQSLDRHQLLRPAKTSYNARYAYTWRANSDSPVARDDVMG